MREQLEQRLKTLKSEYEDGQKALADLEAKQASIRETLLRISSAIQVIEAQLADLNQSPGREISPGTAPKRGG